MPPTRRSFWSGRAAETGLDIRVVNRETEAKLAVSGCASLIDFGCDFALVFDIGGGSSELIWLDLSRRQQACWRRSLSDRLEVQGCIVAWTSLPVGVVTLAERFGGRLRRPRHVRGHGRARRRPAGAVRGRAPAAPAHRRAATRICSAPPGTVTTVAGVHLGLPRYERKRVDGCWLDIDEVRAGDGRACSTATYEQRVAEPCIGRERADLVLAGCAILEAMLQTWPCERLRVADRGLREGILATLMAEDGVYRSERRGGYWRR